MHLCIAGSIRAMPEKEKPPAMPVDIYFFNTEIKTASETYILNIIEKIKR